MTKKRVAVLISGRGSNMVALIEAAQGKDYPAEIALVLSNQPDAAGLTRARDAGIVAAVVDHRQFSDDREAFERSLDEELARTPGGLFQGRHTRPSPGRFPVLRSPSCVPDAQASSGLALATTD